MRTFEDHAKELLDAADAFRNYLQAGYEENCKYWCIATGKTPEEFEHMIFEHQMQLMLWVRLKKKEK